MSAARAGAGRYAPSRILESAEGVQRVSTRIDDPRVQVAVELPNDPSSAGYEELAGIGSGEDRPPIDELATRGWLTQETHVRGTRLLTIGLRIYAAHPELELVNVPTMFLESAIRLMNELAAYVLNGGQLEHEDLMQMRDAYPCLLGFARIAGETPEDELVRVIFLS